jgi:hypothetical protein
VVEAINGEDNSTNLENTNLYIRAIHIHGGMEHNLVGYAKDYSYEEIFLGIGKQMLKISYTLNLG